eukprot:scaffold401_cov399-Prasinococcus_capsulatus_cf.AAC.31
MPRDRQRAQYERQARGRGTLRIFLLVLATVTACVLLSTCILADNTSNRATDAASTAETEASLKAKQYYRLRKWAQHTDGSHLKQVTRNRPDNERERLQSPRKEALPSSVQRETDFTVLTGVGTSVVLGLGARSRDGSLDSLPERSSESGKR